MSAAQVSRWIGLAIGVVAALSACGKSNAPSDAGIDGQLCSLPPNCVGYCTNLVAASCNFPQTKSQLMTLCLDDCTNKRALIPADCMAAWTNAMACAACGTVQCPTQSCSPDGTVCLDQGITVPSCAAVEAQFQSCAGACTNTNLTAGGSGPDGSFEVQTTGCVCPSTLRSGKMAGEACTSSSECAEVCCACSNTRGRFVVRACKNGQCLGDPGICTDMIGGNQFGAC